MHSEQRETQQVPDKLSHSKSRYINQVFMLRNFASECLSLRSEQLQNVRAQKRPSLTVYTR